MYWSNNYVKTNNHSVEMRVFLFITFLSCEERHTTFTVENYLTDNKPYQLCICPFYSSLLLLPQ